MREQASRRIDQPEPGFFRMRLVKNGPYVAARIERKLGFLVASVNGAPAEVDTVWTSGDFIDETTWNILAAQPPSDPYRPLPISKRGIADRMREQDELDWWHTRPIA